MAADAAEVRPAAETEATQPTAPAPGTPGLLRIADAARAVGVSPSALRLWERQGLVTPVRVGRERRYGPDEMTRLRCVHRLRTVEGLNAAGIRRALGESAAAGGRTPSSVAPAPAAGRSDPAAIGARLRSLRLARDLSLRGLGERTGLSASFLSGLERGTSGASLAALVRLAGAYRTTLAALVGDADPPGDEGPGSPEPAPSARERVVRGDARPTLDAGRGVRIEDLAHGPTQLQPQLFVLAPGATSDGAYDHAGEEFLFVLAGRLVVWLAERECHELASGDALTFASSIPHRFVAIGRDETRVLWVNTPPTF